MNKLSTKTLVKIGIVVKDIEEVAKRYAALFDLKAVPEVRVPDPNNLTNPKPGAFKKYKGKEYNILLKSMIVDLDPIYLEIVEPYDDTPSPWRDHLNEHGPGVCFVSMYVKGFDHEIALMEGQGYPPIFMEEKGHERYAYFDTLEKLGLMLELKERDKDI